MLKKAKSTINVLEHALVPEMKIVQGSHVNSVLEKYGIDSTSQLPQIKSGDPEVVALGAKEGDVIKIERVEPTGKCTYYRVVIS